jgi:hypothetical protein
MLWAAAILAVPTLHAYSVLSHEAIIDTVWDREIRALLLKRFPAATDADLVHAHAHAYAGAIVQDMGYYPFGSHFFSDLLRCVRSGDFVVNLIRESQTLDEYAFALGALAHYAADTQGHALAVNPSVAIQYPRLARKYGRSVTFEDDPTAHIRVEFSFDVAQVARGNYAPQAYHDFIGFDVPQDGLERAFERTYSMKMEDIFGDLDLSMATFRHAVSSIVPQMTRVAWHMQKDELKKAQPPIARRRFVYNLSRAAYRKEWSGKYRGPGIGARILAFLIRILPKIGPLKVLAFPAPTPRTESLFELSFDRTLDEYRRLLAEVGGGKLVLPNRDFDTGREVRPGEYRLEDNAYATLARDLAAKPPAEVDPAIRASVLEFFRDLSLPYATKKNAKVWRQTAEALEALRSGAGKTE